MHSSAMLIADPGSLCYLSAYILIAAVIILVCKAMAEEVRVGVLTADGLPSWWCKECFFLVVGCVIDPLK